MSCGLSTHHLAFRPRMIAWLLFIPFAACAHRPTLSQEIVDARFAYNHAVSSPGIKYVAAQMQVARVAMERAERANRLAPNDVDTCDLAYIAMRRAQVAEALGNMERAREQRQRAENVLRSEREILASRGRRDTRLQQQLAMEQLALRDALESLTTQQGSVLEDARGLVLRVPVADLFSNDRQMLLPQARTALDALARVLSGPTALDVTIESYTDARGDAPANIRISAVRARRVMDYLVDKGVSADRLHAEGKGAQDFIASNHERAGRAHNQRIDIVLRSITAAQR